MVEVFQIINNHMGATGLVVDKVKEVEMEKAKDSKIELETGILRPDEAVAGAAGSCRAHQADYG